MNFKLFKSFGEKKIKITLVSFLPEKKTRDITLSV